MNPHGTHIDTLTQRLFVRIQLLRYRTQRLRSWRALHGQIIRSKPPCRDLFTPQAVHRAAVVVVTEDHEPMPLWVN